MKGIILAGGAGTRLYPATKGISKQLVPIYDKPMVYYPLSVLLLSDIREILLISTPQDLPLFRRLLGDGSDWGVQISYAEQPRPEGLAQAFLIGEEFIGDDDVCLVLGDNLFYGQDLISMLEGAVSRLAQHEATVFGYWVQEPQRYGVVDFDAEDRVVGIEEKPACPRSQYAVVGLYFYPRGVVDMARRVKPSARGELEITTLNQMYLEEGRLHVQRFGRGSAWLDTGTFESLYEAASFVKVLESRQGLQIACLEEIAYQKGWIDAAKVREIASPMRHSSYGAYLLQLVEGAE